MVRPFLIALNVVWAMLALFVLGYLVNNNTCREFDANCDGEITLEDVSIHLWRADMTSEQYQNLRINGQ